MSSTCLKNSVEKNFGQQNNYFEQENEKLTEKLNELKNSKTTMSENLEVLQTEITKTSEELRQAIVKEL